VVNIAIEYGNYCQQTVYFWRYGTSLLPDSAPMHAGMLACGRGTMMGEERAQILEMLVAGRVTVEQAEQLLKAIEASSSPRPHVVASRAGAQGRGDRRSENVLAGLTVEQLIALRDRGVTGDYVEHMLSAGLDGLSVKDLIKLHDNGVMPRFVLDLREVGLTDLSCDQLIGLYGHGITANYIREMHALGLTDATPGQLVTMFDHGVDAAFVREMRGLGYTDLTASQWVDLRDNDGEDEDDDTDDQG